MGKPNRQERIFEAIRKIGLTNLQKQQIVRERYNRKHVCHLTSEQGADLEQALSTVIDDDPLIALNKLAIKQEALWSEVRTFPVAPEYAKV